MSKNKAKIYNFNGESFISNMDMSPEEVEEMAQFLMMFMVKVKIIPLI